MGINFDMQAAIKKAEEFLEEHHSTIDLESADLQDGIWYIIFNVGFLSDQIKEVKVDAESGKILGYTDVTDDDEDDDE